jgi:hypothetical protein
MFPLIPNALIENAIIAMTHCYAVREGKRFTDSQYHNRHDNTCTTIKTYKPG